MAIAQDKLVVVGVEVASLRLVLLVVLRLIAVQTLVGIAQGDIEHQFLFLESAEVGRMEHRSVGREVFQIAHVPCRIEHDGAFTMVWPQGTVVGMRSKVKR